MAAATQTTQSDASQVSPICISPSHVSNALNSSGINAEFNVAIDAIKEAKDANPPIAMSALPAPVQAVIKFAKEQHMHSLRVAEAKLQNKRAGLTTTAKAGVKKTFADVIVPEPDDFTNYDSMINYIRKVQYRFSNTGPTIIAAAAHCMMQDLTTYIFSSPDHKDHKMINPEMLGSDYRSLPTSPLFINLPAFLALVDHLQQQREEELKKKLEAAKKPKVTPATDATPATPAVPAVPVAPVVAPVVVPVKDERKQKFSGSVSALINLVKASNPAYADTRVTTQMKDFCESMIVQFMQRINAVLPVVLDNIQQVRTVTEQITANIVRFMLADGGKSPADIDIVMKRIYDLRHEFEVFRKDRSEHRKEKAAEREANPEAVAEPKEKKPRGRKAVADAVPAVDAAPKEKKPRGRKPATPAVPAAAPAVPATPVTAPVVAPVAAAPAAATTPRSRQKVTATKTQ
jgi:hypothetical protein